MSSVQEKLISDHEGQNLDAHWYERRESAERPNQMTLVWQARNLKRAALLRELNDLDQSIVIAKRAGKNTERMKRDWLRLLGEFEAVCRQINDGRAV